MWFIEQLYLQSEPIKIKPYDLLIFYFGYNILEFICIKTGWKLSKTKQPIDFGLCGLLSNFRMQSEHTQKKQPKDLLIFFIFGYKQIDIIYQIDCLVYHRCFPFFIWPKINRFWNLLLVINQIETFSNKHWKRYYLLLICSSFIRPK